MSTDRDRRPSAERRETREVVVDEPGLSAATNARLTEDVRDAVGADRVGVPADRARPSRGETAVRPRPRVLLIPRDFMNLMIVGSGIVGGAILALITNQWWLLPLAVIVLWLMTYAVVRVIVAMTSHDERPAPSTVAAMEEEGVIDPERHFTELVDEFTEEHGAAGTQARTEEPHEDPAKAAAEQRSASTPTGGPSRPVGPRRGSAAPPRRRARERH
jgi:hypothetical protein